WQFQVLRRALAHRALARATASRSRFCGGWSRDPQNPHQQDRALRVLGYRQKTAILGSQHTKGGHTPPPEHAAQPIDASRIVGQARAQERRSPSVEHAIAAPFEILSLTAEGATPGRRGSFRPGGQPESARAFAGEPLANQRSL